MIKFAKSIQYEYNNYYQLDRFYDFLHSFCQND